MEASTTLGVYLRAERERRGLTLRAISESTKVSLPLLEGLEGDDIARWPGGIFRRAFVRAYAEAVGLDPDAVFRRFEQQHKLVNADPQGSDTNVSTPEAQLFTQVGTPRTSATGNGASFPRRARYVGTAADLTVAAVLAFGSAAAGSRLLWPVLMIAAYYAVGILLTGTSPMVALLSQSDAVPARRVAEKSDAIVDADNTNSLLNHSSARTIS
jgi:transcriptional regulator with XRE-family HTH domain